MKKLTVIFCLMIVIVVSKAQTELKLNVSNLPFYEANIDAEWSLAEQFSVGGMLGYDYKKFGPSVFVPGYELESDFYRSEFYIGPFFNWYPEPRTQNDGFFVGLYSKVGFGNIEVNTEYYSPWPSDPMLFGNSNFSRFSLGLQSGYKFVFKEHLVLQILGGVGRNIYQEYEDQRIEDAYFEYEEFYEFFDFRFGIYMGYKF